VKQHKIETPNFDRINPAGCINAKLRRLHRTLNSIYMEKFKPYGIQGSMLSILFIIGKNESVNQKTLAERLVLDPSTMSRDIKKLVNKGWVSISKGDDPRNSLLSITNDGFKLLEEVSPIWEELHHKVETLLGSFSIQQIDSVMTAIGSQKESLRA
jgi:DNA-binding MarR family transcriptional regulator